MPSVKVTSTELLGEMSYTITYEFSSFEDFQKWESDKQQALMGSMAGIGDILSLDIGEKQTEDFLDSFKAATVKKKPKGDLH